MGAYHPRKVLITGAAGNLGGLTARCLLASTGLELHLLIHRKPLSGDLAEDDRVTVFKGDLGKRERLRACLRGVDAVIHYAGVLFKHHPERFLPVTNVQYFQNLCDLAIQEQVRRIILISFPHVEGETFPWRPAAGRLDGEPASVHARTRLDQEKYLFAATARSACQGVSLRAGMVYGRGILMMDVARWLAQRRLLAVWREPTWIHLISRDDFLAAVRSAVLGRDIAGIYHLGDEGVQTLQAFLDRAAQCWGCARPWRLPEPMIHWAATLCEWQSMLLGTPSPLTRDFIRIGRQSYYGDTARMRQELLPALKYPTIEQGRALF